MNPSAIDKLQDVFASASAPQKRTEDPDEFDNLDDYTGLDLSTITGMDSPAAYDADQSRLEPGADDVSFETAAASQNPALPPQDIRRDGEEATSFLSLRTENGRESGMLVGPLETDRRRRRSLSQTPTDTLSHVALVEQLASLDPATVNRMLQLLTSEKSLPSGSASDKASSEACDKMSIGAPLICASTDIVAKAGKAPAQFPVPIPVSRDIAHKIAPAAAAFPASHIPSSNVDKGSAGAPSVVPVSHVPSFNANKGSVKAPGAFPTSHIPSSNVDKGSAGAPAAFAASHMSSANISLKPSTASRSPLDNFLISHGFIPGGPPPRIPSETRPKNSSGFPPGPSILTHLRESLGSGKASPISQRAAASFPISRQSVSLPPDATTGSSWLSNIRAYLADCNDVQIDLPGDAPNATSTPQISGLGFDQDQFEVSGQDFDQDHPSPSSFDNLIPLKSQSPSAFPSPSSNVGASADFTKSESPSAFPSPPSNVGASADYQTSLSPSAIQFQAPGLVDDRSPLPDLDQLTYSPVPNSLDNIVFEDDELTPAEAAGLTSKQPILLNAFERMDKIAKDAAEKTGLSLPVLLEKYAQFKHRRKLSVWNMFQKWFRANIVEALSMLIGTNMEVQIKGIPIQDLEFTPKHISACWSAYRAKHGDEQAKKKLRTWTECDSLVSSQTPAERQRLYRKYNREITTVMTRYSNLYGFEGIFAVAGNMVHTDSSAAGIFSTEGASKFIDLKLKIDEDELLGRLKIHVYTVADTKHQALVKGEGQLDIAIPTMKPQKPSKKPSHRGNSSEVLKLTKESLVGRAGASSLVLSLTSFPWASLFRILQKRGYLIENWPPATPTPNQGGNAKGISGLSLENLLAILEACEAAENPLTFVQVSEAHHDAILASKSPILFFRSENPGSGTRHVIYLDGTEDHQYVKETVKSVAFLSPVAKSRYSNRSQDASDSGRPRGILKTTKRGHDGDSSIPGPPAKRTRSSSVAQDSDDAGDDPSDFEEEHRQRPRKCLFSPSDDEYQPRKRTKMTPPRRPAARPIGKAAHALPELSAVSRAEPAIVPRTANSVDPTAVLPVSSAAQIPDATATLLLSLAKLSPQELAGLIQSVGQPPKP
ncbi:hypothetical protein C8J56DRAFT_905380 [Mycena floridula]|nr:hypothetical protein C8J56DRAFT_905380 [Mycena floridula]